LYYVTLILISIHSAFHINKNLYLVTTCLIWPYFNVPLEVHISKAWLYKFINIHVLHVFMYYMSFNLIDPSKLPCFLWLLKMESKIVMVHNITNWTQTFSWQTWNSNGESTRTSLSTPLGNLNDMQLSNYKFMNFSLGKHQTHNYKHRNCACDINLWKSVL
jgi:hypothetical protein